MPKPSEDVDVKSKYPQGTDRPAPSLKILRLNSQVEMPKRAYDQSSGLDLSAFILREDGVPHKAILAPNVTRVISTGLAIMPPPGMTAFICSRSGMASQGVFVANSPGVVDPDYRGEIKVLLCNVGHQSYYVRHGDRIAQLVLLPTPHFPITEVIELPPSSRGDKGFGSSGQ